MRASSDNTEALAGTDNGWEAQRRELLAACLFHAGRLEELERMPSQHAGVRYWQGLGYARQGLLDQATTMLRQVLAQKPDYRHARQALSVLLRQRVFREATEEDWSLAASLLEEARRVRPSDAVRPEPFLNTDTYLADLFVYLLAGHRLDAVSVLEEALRLKPGNGVVAHSLGLAAYCAARELQEQGQSIGAEYYWRRAVAAWVTVLNDDAFWDEWQQQARKRYQAKITAQDIALLRRQIEEHLTRFFLEKHKDTSEGVESEASPPPARSSGDAGNQET